MPSAPPPLPPARPKTWWDENWWFVAVFGGILFLGLFAFGIFGGLHWLNGRIKSSEGYRLGMAAVRADPKVVAALGEPIEDQDVITGSFTNTGEMHMVVAQMPLKGPKGRATLMLNAVKVGGPWQFATLSVTIESGHQVIDLRSTANRSQ